MLVIRGKIEDDFIYLFSGTTILLALGALVAWLVG